MTTEEDLRGKCPEVDREPASAEGVAPAL